MAFVNNRETIAAIEVNNDTYRLKKRIEKFKPVALVHTVCIIKLYNEQKIGV